MPDISSNIGISFKKLISVYLLVLFPVFSHADQPLQAKLLTRLKNIANCLYDLKDTKKNFQFGKTNIYAAFRLVNLCFASHTSSPVASMTLYCHSHSFQ